MAELKNVELGKANLKMLQGELSGDLSKWIAGVTELIALQGERIAALEKSVADLSKSDAIG